MAQKEFSISISKDAVDVRHTPSETVPRDKLFGFIFSVSGLVLFDCALLFLPGKHGRPSMWQDITSGSGTFAIVLLTIGTGLMAWSIFRYSRAAWPSDETFHCDRDHLTISRVPWLDFSNRRWRTRAYPLQDVSKIRFAVIASAKGRSFWGIRFRAHGRKWALPGLEAPDAKTILMGLKALGADVPDDPKLEKRIKEWKDMQFGNTDWMDRSWMEPEKQPPSDDR